MVKQGPRLGPLLFSFEPRAASCELVTQFAAVRTFRDSVPDLCVHHEEHKDKSNTITGTHNTSLNLHKKFLVKIFPAFVIAVIWLIVATVLHIIPGSSLPKDTWLSQIKIDKWVHIAIFFIMVIVWFLALRKRYTLATQRQLLLSVVLASMTYGVVMEFVQKYFVINRSFDLWDLVADAAGCVARYIFCFVRYIKK